jgi:hypothetical protein
LGTENPCIVKEHIRNSPKFKIWYDLMHSQITGLFFSKKQQSPRIPGWKWRISIITSDHILLCSKIAIPFTGVYDYGYICVRNVWEVESAEKAH